MDMDTSPLIGVWTADNGFHTIEFTATMYIDKFSGLICDYTDNGNSITLSNCMGVEGAENLNGATVEYTIDGDTLTFDGTTYTRQNSDVPEPTVPGTMAAPSLEAGNEQLRVNWTAPEETGDSEITAYELRHSDDGGSSWSEDITTADAPATETIITGLTNGTPYVAQVRARNSAGAGEWSESSAEATPIGVSLAPNGFMLAVSMQTITATWTAPTDTGDSPIIRYELQHRVAGVSAWEPVIATADADTLTLPIPNLTKGAEYEVQVYAVNGQGNGNPTEIKKITIPATKPSAMNAPTLTTGDNNLTATWTAPDDDGGSAITAYHVQYSSDGESAWTAVTDIISATAASHTITGLVSGTSYNVQVRAVNAVDNGDWSASATETARIIGTQAPFGTAASVILSAAINTQIADEILTVTLATATTPVAGVTVALPTVNASTGIITVTATTTAGTYVVSGATGGENKFTEKFYVTVSPTTNAELDTQVAAGISTWGNTADLNYIVTTAVTDMLGVFLGAYLFNQDISGWDVSSVTNMRSMLRGANSFNGDISGWDVSKVTDMSNIFYEAAKFNSDISSWNVSKVTNMFSMFRNAGEFNIDISSWDVSKVTNMSNMFYEATKFNSNISQWTTNAVEDMASMFAAAQAFNADISEWDVSKVTNMSLMFFGAQAFNANISSWNVDKVTNMRRMFSGATAFSQDLNNWAKDANGNNLTTGSWNNGTYTGNKTSMFVDSGLDSGDTTDPETAVTQPNYPSWYW